MNVKKVVNSIAVGFIVFGSVTVLLATIIAVMNQSFNDMYLSDMEHTAEMVRISESNTISFKDLQYLKEESGVEKISGYSEIVALVSNKAGISGDDVKIVLVDEDYSSVYKYELIMGRFPDADSVKKGKAYAVISDQLALKLFMTYDIVGNEIIIMGQKHIISGVYISGNSIIRRLCGDGYDRVFIPYTGIDGYLEAPVDIAVLQMKPDQSVSEIKIKLNALIDQKMSSYIISDHMISSTIFHQYFDLLLFIIGMSAILFTVLFLIRYTICIYRVLKKKLEAYYVRSLVEVDKREVISILSVFFIGAVCIVFILNVIRFKFIIADRYIPDDNIFDMQFYINTAIKDRMIANSYKINVHSIFDYYFKNILQFNIYCTLLISVFFIISNMLYNLLLQLGVKLKKIMSAALFIIFAGGATGVLIAVSSGFDAYYPIKLWMIISYYLFIKFFSWKIHKSNHIIFWKNRKRNLLQKCGIMQE